MMLRKVIVLVVSLLQLLLIQANVQHKQKTDSLLSKLHSTTVDSIKIHCYNELSFHNVYVDIEKTKLYADSALNLAEKGNLLYGMAVANRLIGIYHIFVSDIPKALDYTNKALLIAEQINDNRIKAKCYNILGTLYRRMAAYERALDYYYKAVNLENGENEVNNKTRNLLSIAIIHRLIGNYEKTEEHLKELETLCYQLKDTFLIGNYHYELAALKYKTKDFYQSELHCDKALEFFKILDSEYNILNAISLKALLRSAQGRYDQAIEIYNQSIKRSEQIGNKIGVMTDYINIASAYSSKKDFVSAKKYALDAVKLGDDLGIERKPLNAYVTLYKIEEIEGNYKTALEYHKKLKEINDSVFSIERNKQIENLEIIYETEKKQNEIELLKKDAIILDKESKKRKMQRNLSILSSLFLVVILIFILNRMSLSKKLYKQSEKRLIAEAKYKEEEALRKEEELKATAEINKLNADLMKEELDHRNREITSSALYVAQKNEILGTIGEKLDELKGFIKAENKKDLNQLKRLIKENIELDEDWNNFKLHFDKVHPKFFEKLVEKYPELTANEQKTCAYLRMNLSSKEIARLLNITPKSTQMSRYRLKKKFNLGADDDLMEFICKI